METQLVVAYGETNLDRLDTATHYQNHQGDVVAVVDRTTCRRCRRTNGFHNMEGGLFVTFNGAHLSCARAG